MLSPHAKQLERNGNSYMNATSKGQIVATREEPKRLKNEFDGSDLFRQVAFGGTVGSFTGMVFGFMDSMKKVQESKVLAKASNTAKGKFLLQGTTRSGLVFGAFFSGFHAMKYGTKIAIDPGEISEIVFAAAVSMAGLGYKPSTRSSMPYGAMLIVMDCVSSYMREE